jgi:hypothetical protein
MMAIDCSFSYGAYSYLYDGSAWGNYMTITTFGIGRGDDGIATFADAVADGDNVDFVCVFNAGSNAVDYCKYTYDSGWGSLESVQSSMFAADRGVLCPSITLVSSDHVRVFYFCNFQKGDAVNYFDLTYRDRISGVWQSPVTIIASDPSACCLECSYEPSSGNFCVVWEDFNSSADTYEVNAQLYSPSPTIEEFQVITLFPIVLILTLIAIGSRYTSHNRSR